MILTRLSFCVSSRIQFYKAMQYNDDYLELFQANQTDYDLSVK